MSGVTTTADNLLVTSFTIAVDTREQRAYRFEGLRADACRGRRPLLVQSVPTTLRQGDYSLVGHEHEIAIERKSLADLYSTLGGGRGRFERELRRLDALQWAAVVIEADWSAILDGPPGGFSRLNPKTIYRSIIAWQQQFPRVHWWPASNRRLAEVTTFRILERFHRVHHGHRYRSNDARGNANGT